MPTRLWGGRGARALELPDGYSLDDMDSLCLWCVDASVSFGDGVFAAP